MKISLHAIALALALHVPTIALSQESAAPGLVFLAGEWAGSGSGSPGQGINSFSFLPDVQNRVFVRRAHTEYPAAAGRPAVVHDDLMVVYAAQSKAIYFNNEGHVIHYDVRIDADSRGASFTSTDPPPSPLFRLAYRQRGADELAVSFEIAQSGRSEDLKTHVFGTVKRSQAVSR